ncbi:MAG: cell division protein ZapA [Rhodospirillales bacterium]|jgi:cell division protein ZapA|nr:cell division protein ZapA [Rhodospirillales bacterium]
MAQVTVRINGFSYTVGCQDGEETHLLAMAGEVERRIESIKAVAGPSSESRMLVMAALLLADDLHETRAAAAQHGAEGADATDAAASRAQAEASRAAQARQERRLARLAKQAEDIANGLENPS